MDKEPAYLAIDPGETSGWALFDENGEFLQMGQFKMGELNESLKELVLPILKHIIIEDYRNHGFAKGGQKKWSRNDTSKNIGKIELMADLQGVPYTLQSNTVKSIGYRWGGLPGPPKNHSISHQYDAYAHGRYWLQRNGITAVGQFMRKEDLK